MPSNEVPDLQELFAVAGKERPRRTYKGRNRRAASFPALKPSTDPGPRLQLFRLGRPKSWDSEVKQVLPAVTEQLQLQTVREEQTDTNEDGSRGSSAREGGSPPRERIKEIKPTSIEDPEEISSPVTPPRFSGVTGKSDEPEVLEAEDEDDSDPIAILQPIDHNQVLKDAKQTPNQVTGLRLRPFLIFENIPNKGYKKLNHKSPAKTALPASRFRPGDGFSGREAKPNGLNLLTRNGKQAITSPHLGILDLTQSEPPTKQKRNIRRANLEDNSFAPAPKKTRRRPEKKDARRPATAAKVAQPTVKKSSSELKAIANVTTPQPAPKKGTGHASKAPAQETAVGKARTLPQKAPSQNNVPKDDAQIKLDTSIMEWNDDVQQKLGKTSKPSGTSQEEQDSYETHISNTPPRQLRASSESSVMSPRQEGGGVLGEVSQRVFRRFNTQ